MHIYYIMHIYTIYIYIYVYLCATEDPQRRKKLRFIKRRFVKENLRQHSLLDQLKPHAMDLCR